jgi:ferredoxin-NADP reductase/DMSO/TMAO reductase YedYZ heme-binding membrane subunit
MITLLARIIGSRIFWFPLLALPALYLWNENVQGRMGTWKVEDMQDFTGNTAIILLITVLCFTPLRVLFPRSRLVAALNRHRRATGVACFLYAAAHFYAFLRFSKSYETVINDLSNFVYLQAGLAALILLAILALTSNNLAVWILRYPLWKLLHRLAYFAAALAFFHRAFGAQKTDQLPTTLALFAPLIVLEILRVAKQLITGTFKRVYKLMHQPAFKGWRKFRVARIVHENADITSIYLEPAGRWRRKLKPFKPGQYLTYEFTIPGQPDPILRSYSLSDAPNPRHYRASIKRVPPPRDHPDYPPGLSSNFVHDQLEEGDILRVRAPAGTFTLDPRGHSPVVLLGSGIGLTPVLSMVKSLAAHRSKREIWFFCGVRNKSEDALRAEFKAAVAAMPNARLFVCHSDPDADEIPGLHHDVASRINVELLKKHLPHNRYDFYFCGPAPMMEATYHDLLAWGVPEKRLHYEAFGPSSLNKHKLPKGVASSARITFRKSKKSLVWDGGKSSILELAESQGLHLKFGCRAGACGTCKLRLRKGGVIYSSPPGADPGAGHCLVCIGMPAGDLEIDA